MLTMTFISISRTTLSLIIQTSHISGETFRKILPSKLTKIFIEKEMFWAGWKYLYLETKKARYRLHHTPLLCNTIMIFWYFDEFQYLNVFPRFDIWKEFFILYFLCCRLDHKPDSWDLRDVCVSVGDSWFISPLYLFTAMVHAGEQSLLEYDFKTSVSVDLEESDGGWEIIILEARIEDCLISSKVQKMKPKKEPHFIISSTQGPFLGLSN